MPHEAADGAAQTDQGAQAMPEGRRRMVLAATVLASAMAFIDGSVVTIALPVIQEQMQASFQELQWIVNAYTLMLGALILVGGALGDRLGRKRIFVTGIAIFAVASLACALATNATILIAARTVQGIGAALLVPQSLAIIAASFPRDVRGRAIGVWAAASAITTSLGPPLGGLLIDLWSWRIAFLINIPLSIAALWLTFACVPESRDPGARGPIDWLGAVVAVVSLAALTYGLTALTDQTTPAAIVAGVLLLGIVGLAVFWRVEKHAPNATLPPSLFKSRPFLVTNIVTLFLYGALAGVLFLLPFDLIERRGMSASAVGMTLLPFGLIIGLLSRPVGAFADRYGREILPDRWLARRCRRRSPAGAQHPEFLDWRVRAADRHGARHGRRRLAAHDNRHELRARRALRRGLRHQQCGQPSRGAGRRRRAWGDSRIDLRDDGRDRRRPLRQSAGGRRPVARCAGTGISRRLFGRHGDGRRLGRCGRACRTPVAHGRGVPGRPGAPQSAERIDQSRPPL